MIVLKRIKAFLKRIKAYCHISIPPENVRKPKVFLRFQGVYKCDTGLKWVNANLIMSGA